MLTGKQGNILTLIYIFPTTAILIHNTLIPQTYNIAWFLYILLGNRKKESQELSKISDNFTDLHIL